jgi:hypothetical protein
MTWFKENKFVAGVLIVTLLGAGVLGWLLLGAKGKYDESAANFDKQATELKRLETAPAYPDKTNLEVLEEQRLKQVSLIEDLQKSLAATEFPLEPVTPTVFQDQLRAAVTALLSKPGVMQTPKGFYYGFEPYQTALPPPDAAPLLLRELKAIQQIFQIMLDKAGGRVQAVTSFTREALPEESGKPAQPVKPAVPLKPGQKPAPVVEPLVKPHPVDMIFIAEQRAVAEILNALAANKQQFYITRYIALHNTNERPPPRDATAAAPGAAVAPEANVLPVAPPPGTAPAAPGAPGVPGVPEKDPIILGNEKVEVTMRLEIVDFAPPKPEATPAPKAIRNAGK